MLLSLQKGSALPTSSVNALRTTTLGGLGSDIAVPGYDRSALTPGIVHFGVGGFHRAHEAAYLDTLMNQGQALDWGIRGVGLLPGDIAMRDVMSAQDGLYTLVLKHSDGHWDARVIGSIIDYLYAPDDPGAVLDALADPAIRIVSLTITEGGYALDHTTGKFDPSAPALQADLNPANTPTTVFGFITRALARRRDAGIPSFTIMSCDNIQANGDVARDAFTSYAELADPDLAEWMHEHTAFPNSMVDRITPATTQQARAEVRTRFGFDDAWPVLCEPFTQWVLQDQFGASRPPWEDAGVQLVPDVEPYELMKLRLLNASHQAMGYSGYLAGHRLVHDVARDPLFARFLLDYMRKEAIPTLRPVPGIDLTEYTDELIARFSNPEVGDTLARLCSNSSDLIPKFILPVLRAQLATGGPIEHCTAVIACWARYAEGSDEHGEPITIVDPLSAQLTAAARQQRSAPASFLALTRVFGDLVDQPRFVDTYVRILASLHNHGVRATLHNLTTIT